MLSDFEIKYNFDQFELDVIPFDRQYHHDQSHHSHECQIIHHQHQYHKSHPYFLPPRRPKTDLGPNVLEFWIDLGAMLGQMGSVLPIKIRPAPPKIDLAKHPTHCRKRET